MSQTRVLDWRSRHDEQSKQYPIRTIIGATVTRKFTTWTVGPVLDQGEEGACVGHGFTDEATAEPVPVNFAVEDLGNDDKGQPWPKDAQAFAFALYNWCRRNDETPGEDYDGTSVLTGAKGMKKLGLIPQYRWALSMADVIDTICAYGPVVLGIDWLDGMYDAPAGELRAAGVVVGGHCILAVGYDPDHQWNDGTRGEGILLMNSWGESFGVKGLAWIRVTELAKLLAKNGEACVPVRRDDPAIHVTPAPVTPVPTPTPTPKPEPKPEPKPKPDPKPAPVDEDLKVLIKKVMAALVKLLERLG